MNSSKSFPEISVEQAVVAAGGEIIGDKVSCYNKSGHNNGDKNPSGYFVKGKDGRTRYHCHCNAGGDAYDILRQTGLTAHHANKIPYTKIKPVEKIEIDPVFQSKVLDLVWTLTPPDLPEKVRLYLQGRGFLNTGTFRFMDWKKSVQIANTLLSKFPEKKLLDAKFIRKSKRDEYYFLLHSRILIPWRNEKGEIQFLQGRSHE